MSMNKDNTKQIYLTIPVNILEKIDTISFNTGVPRASVIKTKLAEVLED
jgi:predicted DNA-binding protein